MEYSSIDEKSYSSDLAISAGECGIAGAIFGAAIFIASAYFGSSSGEGEQDA